MSQLKLEEISSVIEEKIKNFELDCDMAEVGKVVSYADGVAKVYGLNGVMSYEVLEFETGDKGVAANLEEDSVGVIVFGFGNNIKEGTSVKRTKSLMKVPVGDAVVGRVLNALGEPIDGKGEIETNEFSLIEQKAPGIMDRKSVHEPLQTGIKAIDALVPIGRGQRELIIGDKQTGKTTVAIDAIINQKRAKCDLYLCGYWPKRIHRCTSGPQIRRIRSDGIQRRNQRFGFRFSCDAIFSPLCGCGYGGIF